MKMKKGEIILSHDLKLAYKASERMVGLMFKDEMVGYDGLLIKPCNSIHTFFMKFSIDAIFLDKNFKIKKIYRNLKPWRMTRLVFGATQVLELQSGTVSKDIVEGDILELCTN